MSKLSEVIFEHLYVPAGDGTLTQAEQAIKNLVLSELQAVLDEQNKRSLLESNLTRHHFIKAFTKRIEDL